MVKATTWIMVSTEQGEEQQGRTLDEGKPASQEEKENSGEDNVGPLDHKDTGIRFLHLRHLLCMLDL